MSSALISCLFDTIFAARKLMRAVGFLRAGASTLRDPNLGSVGRRLAPILERAAVTTFGTSTRVVHYLGRHATRAIRPTMLFSFWPNNPSRIRQSLFPWVFACLRLTPVQFLWAGVLYFRGRLGKGAMAWWDQCFPGQVRPGWAMLG